MGSNCCDELIIMLLFSRMIKVTLGRLERVTQDVKSGPVVIRQSLCNSQCSTHYILIYSLITTFENY